MKLWFGSCYSYPVWWSIRHFWSISIRVYNSRGKWSSVRWYIRCSGWNNFVNIRSDGKENIYLMPLNRHFHLHPLFQAKTTAFVYFMIGNVVLFVSIITYIIMSKTVFFKYYTVDKLAMSKSSSSVALPSSSTTDRVNGPDFQVVLRKIWVYGLAEWMVFVVTLCIYPSVTVLVTSQNHGNGHPWNGNRISDFFVCILELKPFSVCRHLLRSSRKLFNFQFRWLFGTNSSWNDRMGKNAYATKVSTGETKRQKIIFLFPINSRVINRSWWLRYHYYECSSSQLCFYVTHDPDTCFRWWFMRTTFSSFWWDCSRSPMDT